MKKTEGEEFPQEEIPGAPPDPNSPAERFYGAAVTRIVRWILVLGIAGSGVAFAGYGVHMGVSFLLGSGLAWWNFRTLASNVNSLGERIVVGHSREKGSVIIVRFISRVLLVGMAGYAIFLSWPRSLPGFLAGVCMSVPALVFEAGYECFSAFRRGL